VFVYYPVSINVNPVPPSLTFDDPPYSYTCTGLSRTSRGAITYTDFEKYPLQGWTNDGGTNFQLVPGYKGYALQYSDNNGGIGYASQYYYNSDLSSHTSLRVEVKVYGSPTNTWKGLALINSGLSRLYEIWIYNSDIEIWSYNVESTSGWYRFGSATISNYNSNYWYSIVLNYAVTGNAVNFYVWVYDPNGNQVAYLTASSKSNNRFTPSYLGLEVDGNYGIFDDFIISTVDPRSVLFTNLQSGLTFNIYDNLGSLTYSFTATSNTYNLNVIKDVVLGTGSGGNIQVLKPDGSICLNVTIPSNDAFLGGDSYSLITKPLSWSISSSKTSASVSAYISSNSNNSTSFYAIGLKANQNYYVQLQLNAQTSTIAPGLNAQIGIQGGSQSIAISSGAVSQSSTDWVQVSSGSTKYITVSNAYSSSSSSSTLVFNVLACTAGRLDIDPAPGACVEYPLTITLNSG